MQPAVTVDSISKKKTLDGVFYTIRNVWVDSLDRICRKYLVKAPSRRWSVHTFYNLLDLAGINVWVFYKIIVNT